MKRVREPVSAGNVTGWLRIPACMMRSVCMACQRTLRSQFVLLSVLLALAGPVLGQVEMSRRSVQPLHAEKPAVDRISVVINGKPFTEFFFGESFPKPFLHPLRSADGRVVTRQFPMVQIEGESHDHPHHRGLFIGYGSINGINFWENEKSYTSTNRGTIILQHEPRFVPGKREGLIEAAFEWRNPDGQVMLVEDRTMTFYADGRETLDEDYSKIVHAQSDRRIIDFDIAFTARQDLHFEDTKEGFFAIRIADSMKEDQGGQMVSSTGLRTEKQVWGTKADWVDYTGPVDGRPVGIAIFDSPANRNHPPRWHSRAYGLFALNPWGKKDFDKTAPGEGGLKLKSGDQMRLRYRVLIHDNPMTSEPLNQAYQQYAKAAN
jgi:hypothetical protein